MKIKRIVLAILLIGVLFACNKSGKNAKRLIKAGTWKVTEVSVDGVSLTQGSTWEIESCDHNEELCFGEWKTAAGGHALFAWQFRDKGNSFELSRQEEEEEHAHGTADILASEISYGCSGVYELEESGKGKMVIKSSSTVGYSGKSVRIVIEQ